MGEKLLNKEQVNLVVEFSDALRNYGWAEGFWSPWQSNQLLKDLTGSWFKNNLFLADSIIKLFFIS